MRQFSHLYLSTFIQYIFLYVLSLKILLFFHYSSIIFSYLTSNYLKCHLFTTSYTVQTSEKSLKSYFLPSLAFQTLLFHKVGTRNTPITNVIKVYHRGKVCLIKIKIFFCLSIYEFENHWSHQPYTFNYWLIYVEFNTCKLVGQFHKEMLSD